MTKNLVILISGNGSNLQAIIDAIESGRIKANISLVLSNKADAYGLERARLAGIKTAILSTKAYETREAYDTELMDIIDNYEPNLVILAGFMRILSEKFVKHYAGKLLNIHPSLLPKYKGLKTHDRVLEAGDKIHGATVHYVTDELDGGPIIQQASCDVLPTDTAASLEARVHELEHRLYPEVIAKLL